MYDLVVVGGNLAGTAAALSAREKGASVALIEKRRSPHNPAHCGEGIDPITAGYINVSNTSIHTNPINHMTISVSPTTHYHLHFKHTGLIIFDRYHLEKTLLDACKQQGVDLYIGHTMNDYSPPHTIRTRTGKELEGSIIIDASGIHCAVGRTIGMKPKLKPSDIGVCIQSRIHADVDANTVKTWFHTPYAPFGYGWVFPIDETTANIGIGIPGGQHQNLPALLDSYITHEFGDEYTIKTTFYACVPLASPLPSLIKDNVLITGDAARLTNAFLGSGIANALISGSLAGAIGSDYIQQKLSSFQLYQELLTPKIHRLQNVYHRRKKTLFTPSFYLVYKRGFHLLSLLNKLMPTIFNHKVKQALGKDIDLIKQYKKTPTLF